MVDKERKTQDKVSGDDTAENIAKARREFLKKAGVVTVAAAPAAALLLSAKATRAQIDTVAVSGMTDFDDDGADSK